MACKQVFAVQLPNGATATRYTGPRWEYEWSATLVAVPWQVAGIFRGASITHLTAPGAGKSFTYTLVKNGSDTALVITISELATTGSSSVSVAVAAGDLVYWRRTTSGTPTLSEQKVSSEFWGTAVGESGYGSIDGWNNAATWRGPLFNQGQFNTGAAGTNNFEVVGAAGNLTSLSYRLATAPGSGNSYEVSVWKNGTKQDGSGGTPDTRVTIADSAITGSWTGTLSLAAGDYVYLETVPTSNPSDTAVGIGARFVATTDGESQGGGLVFTNLPTTGGPYYASPNQYSQNWDTTEIDVNVPGGIASTITVRALRIRLGNTVSTGPITFSLRKNAATSALAATLTTGQQTGSDLVDSVTIAPGDTWSMQYSQSGSPGTARIAAFGFAVFAQFDPAVVGSFVAGVHTTVQGERAAAFGLDGNVNVHNTPGMLKVFGDLSVTGSINSGRIQFAEVSISSSEILNLRATPKTLVAAPGAGLLAEFVAIVLLLDATATAYVESTDNLAVKYENGSGAQVSETIETTGFIDQTVDTMTTGMPRTAVNVLVAKTGCEDKALVLHNIGDSEYTTGTGVLRAKVSYRLWTTGW